MLDNSSDQKQEELLPLPEKDLPLPEKLLRAPTFMEKYREQVIIACICLFILLLLAFAPTPYYQTYTGSCGPGAVCPPKGWHLGPSVWKVLLTKCFTPKTNQIAAVIPIVSLSPKPTSETMANWETYTNKKYNFSFQHPKRIDTQGGSQRLFTEFIKEKDWGISVECGCEAFTWFTTEVIPGSLTPSEWWNTYGKQLFNGKVGTNNVYHMEAYEATVSIRNLNGHNILVVKARTSIPTLAPTHHPYAPTEAQDFMIYIVPSKDKLAIITQYIFLDDKMFNQILSTYKFTQ